MLSLKNCLLTVCLLSISIFAKGQAYKYREYNKFKKSYTIGLGVGASQYMGDIHPYQDPLSFLSTPRWNAGIYVTHHYSSRLSFQVAFSWIRILGDDYSTTINRLNSEGLKYRFLRNLHFRNDIKELSLIGRYNLKGGFYNYKNSNRPGFMPYLFSGISLFTHSPEIKEVYEPSTNPKWIKAQEAGAIPSVNLGIPLGIGFSKKLSNRLDLNLELCYRFTFTDLLDDIKNEAYPLTPSFYNNRSQERYSYKQKDRLNPYNEITVERGFSPSTGGLSYLNGLEIIGHPSLDPKRGEGGADAYFTFSVQLHYYFDKKVKCP